MSYVRNLRNRKVFAKDFNTERYFDELMALEKQKAEASRKREPKLEKRRSRSGEKSKDCEGQLDEFLSDEELGETPRHEMILAGNLAVNKRRAAEAEDYLTHQTPLKSKYRANKPEIRKEHQAYFLDSVRKNQFRDVMEMELDEGLNPGPSGSGVQPDHYEMVDVSKKEETVSFSLPDDDEMSNQDVEEFSTCFKDKNETKSGMGEFSPETTKSEKFEMRTLFTPGKDLNRAHRVKIAEAKHFLLNFRKGQDLEASFRFSDDDLRQAKAQLRREGRWSFNRPVSARKATTKREVRSLEKISAIQKRIAFLGNLSNESDPTKSPERTPPVQESDFPEPKKPRKLSGNASGQVSLSNPTLGFCNQELFKTQFENSTIESLASDLASSLGLGSTFISNLTPVTVLPVNTLTITETKPSVVTTTGSSGFTIKPPTFHFGSSSSNSLTSVTATATRPTSTISAGSGFSWSNFGSASTGLTFDWRSEVNKPPSSNVQTTASTGPASVRSGSPQWNPICNLPDSTLVRTDSSTVLPEGYANQQNTDKYEAELEAYKKYCDRMKQRRIDDTLRKQHEIDEQFRRRQREQHLEAVGPVNPPLRSPYKDPLRLHLEKYPTSNPKYWDEVHRRETQHAEMQAEHLGRQAEQLKQAEQEARWKDILDKQKEQRRKEEAWKSSCLPRYKSESPNKVTKYRPTPSRMDDYLELTSSRYWTGNPSEQWGPGYDPEGDAYPEPKNAKRGKTTRLWKDRFPEGEPDDVDAESERHPGGSRPGTSRSSYRGGGGASNSGDHKSHGGDNRRPGDTGGRPPGGTGHSGSPGGDPPGDDRNPGGWGPPGNGGDDGPGGGHDPHDPSDPEDDDPEESDGGEPEEVPVPPEPLGEGAQDYLIRRMMAESMLQQQQLAMYQQQQADTEAKLRYLQFQLTQAQAEADKAKPRTLLKGFGTKGEIQFKSKMEKLHLEETLLKNQQQMIHIIGKLRQRPGPLEADEILAELESMNFKVQEDLREAGKKEDALKLADKLKRKFEPKLKMPEIAYHRAEVILPDDKILSHKTIVTTIPRFNPDLADCPDFYDVWRKILIHTSGTRLTERHYQDILAKVFQGSALDTWESMMEAGDSLQAMLDSFAQMYTKKNTIKEDTREYDHFVRKAHEPIKACMNRARIRLDKLQGDTPPALWEHERSKLLKRLLRQVISPETRQHLALEEYEIEKAGHIFDLNEMINVVDSYEYSREAIPTMDIEPTELLYSGGIRPKFKAGSAVKQVPVQAAEPYGNQGRSNQNQNGKKGGSQQSRNATDSTPKPSNGNGSSDRGRSNDRRRDRSRESQRFSSQPARNSDPRSTSVPARPAADGTNSKKLDNVVQPRAVEAAQSPSSGGNQEPGSGQVININQQHYWACGYCSMKHSYGEPCHLLILDKQKFNRNDQTRRPRNHDSQNPPKDENKGNHSQGGNSGGQRRGNGHKNKNGGKQKDQDNSGENSRPSGRSESQARSEDRSRSKSSNRDQRRGTSLTSQGREPRPDSEKPTNS